VPHIHIEQVLQDLNNWNKEKEAEYLVRQAEKLRQAQTATEMAEARKREKQQALQRYEEDKRKRREDAKREAGEYDWDSDAYVDDTQPP
jgi:hypothetical protein